MSIFGEVVLIVYLVGAVLTTLSVFIEADLREPFLEIGVALLLGIWWPVSLPVNLILRRRSKS